MTELEGIAEVDGETLSFEDEVDKVKGIIIIQDNMAVFTTIESGFELLIQETFLSFLKNYSNMEYHANFKHQEGKV